MYLHEYAVRLYLLLCLSSITYIVLSFGMDFVTGLLPYGDLLRQRSFRFDDDDPAFE
jgi:hypothetical protein